MNKLNKKIKKNGGMSYVELIVVLSIFSVMTSVVVYNYGDFQAKVDIKNLASDIALKIVEAQKSSLNGLLPTQGGYIVNWKPSYGVYLNTTTPALSKQFIYFADLNNFNGYEAGAEKLNTIIITKNNYIFEIDKCTNETCTNPGAITSLAIIFKRPDSGAVFKDSNGVTLVSFDYIKITIKSPKSNTATIRVYPSGRIQVN